MKNFVDAVYGHIHIPIDYCKKIIDTPLFQRLKRIEQTSMRPLFPCARHDRFSHSLGTFHIGCIIFENIKKNAQKDGVYEIIKELKIDSKEETWKYLQINYELACLLHDCGHAPFSHTFEKYYLNRGKKNDANDLGSPLQIDIANEMKSYVRESLQISEEEKNIRITKFIKQLCETDAAPHELVSAWLVLHKAGFREQIQQLHGDPELIARMIIGCKYDKLKESSDVYHQICDCFIELLNGKEIDADRTDYVIRDKWATGLNTATIDLTRLYSSIHLKSYNNKYIVCYSQKALPELESILEVKNYNSFWIFNHHKLLYHNYILIKAVEKLALIFSGEKKLSEFIKHKKDNTEDGKKEADRVENDALYSFFDYHNLITPRSYKIKIGNDVYDEVLYRLCDDDLVYLLKKYFCSIETSKTKILKEFYSDTNYAQEWFSRQYELYPLWKSDIEYQNKFVIECLDYNVIKYLNIQWSLKTGEEDSLTQEQIDQILKDNPIIQFIEKIHQKKKRSSIEYLSEKYLSKPISVMRFKKILKDIGDYYKESIDNSILKIVQTRIKELLTDSSYELNNKTCRYLNPDHTGLTAVQPGRLFIDLDDEKIECFTKLNIPRRNHKDEYHVFYIYIPRIFGKNHKEIDIKQYNKLYKNDICRKINELIIPNNIIDSIVSLAK